MPALPQLPRVANDGAQGLLGLLVILDRDKEFTAMLFELGILQEDRCLKGLCCGMPTPKCF